MNKLPALFLACVIACAPKGGTADSAAAGLAAIDTLKPAASDSLAATDSGVTAAAREPAGATTRTKAGTAAPPTGTKTAPADSTNIGRDRAIQFDPKRPRLPVVDTTKRPPQA